MPSDCVNGGGSSNGLDDTNHNPFTHFTNDLTFVRSRVVERQANLTLEGMVPISTST